MPTSFEETSIDGKEMDPEMGMEPPITQKRNYTTHVCGAVKRKAYRFDGQGKFFDEDRNLSEGDGGEFYWYHFELSRFDQRPAESAKPLIEVLCPPLQLHDIVSLLRKGPFCENVNGALVFRVNAPGPTVNKFTQSIAARISEKSVITVSLGKVPRLGDFPTGQSLLSEIPSVECPPSQRHYGEKDEESSKQARKPNSVVIGEDVLESLLTMNHSEDPVPTKVSNLLVHIVDTFVDHLQDIATKLEMELGTIELELHKGGNLLKKQKLDERLFPKTPLNLQHLLQVIVHGEEVFPGVKDKCAQRTWFAREDIGALEVLVDRLMRLKKRVGFIVNRVTAIQAGLDSWQSEQINTKLYYISCASMSCLPFSIITGVFGMNVGGVPWTAQKDPTEYGFRNVLLIGAAISFLLLAFCGAGIRDHKLILNTKKHTLTSLDC